ncbi:MAG: hypothetical protein JXB03_10060 [Spirochaetales bacterium]|nr:hypothetical protein [Spirochaetales bacterium]
MTGRSFLVTGFDNQRAARDYVKDRVRFLPHSGIEVWLTDPPGVLITGENLSSYDVEALKDGRAGILPVPVDEDDPGVSKRELLYGGIY